ncbi:hypothetical protein RJ641_027906 [Dillenia turbinata]|uniref:BTB domain-containing protein n=1 Tax=Dillenia turbinata TaxID=194707 RepID=A0AAN8W3B9_9MAGN
MIGDRSSSDVVYCHSSILVEKSKYFADRLSEKWPTCQILDSPVELGCQQIVTACVDFLEAVPWEEAEEEEILRAIPGMGSQAAPIIARPQPVNPAAIVAIFLAAVRFATSSPSPMMHDLKCSAQEQLEYMLTEDDDAPLLTADDEIKSEVRECVRKLLSRFINLLESLLCEPKDSVPETQKIWVEASEKIVKYVDRESADTLMLEAKLKAIEVASKVLEAVGYGTVILPTAKRLLMVKVWLPFVRATKPLSKQAEILSEWLSNKYIRYPNLTEVFEVWCYRSKVAKRRLSMLTGVNGEDLGGKIPVIGNRMLFTYIAPVFDF